MCGRVCVCACVREEEIECLHLCARVCVQKIEWLHECACV